jgi:protein-S-isoprenylcysteine O-methyltransferase Ste14
MLSLLIRNTVFTVVVPGLGGGWVPVWLLTRDGGTATPVAWEAVPVIAAGAVLYLCCAWNFAAVGRGTPGPWDAPRRVVARGPYRWVRNPIYLAALLVVLGEAGLFGSLRLLAYAGVLGRVPQIMKRGWPGPDPDWGDASPDRQPPVVPVITVPPAPRPGCLRHAPL